MLDLMTFVHGFGRGCRDYGPFIPPCRDLQFPKLAKRPCQASNVHHKKRVMLCAACRVILSKDTVTLDGLLVGNHR